MNSLMKKSAGVLALLAAVLLVLAGWSFRPVQAELTETKTVTAAFTPASAANGQNNVDALLLADSGSGSDAFNFRIGSDTAKLEDFKVVQQSLQPVIKPGFLDTAAAIGQKNFSAVGLKLFGEMGFLTHPEQDIGSDAEFKIFHEVTPLYSDKLVLVAAHAEFLHMGELAQVRAGF